MRQAGCPVVLCLALLATSARAGVIWVAGRADANGSDGAPHRNEPHLGADPNGDGSPSRPYTTIAATLKAARPGDVVTVKAGLYHETLKGR